MEKTIYDEVLGKIVLRFSNKARRYSLNVSGGMVHAVIPVGGEERKMLSFIKENRAKLLAALDKAPAPSLLDDSTIWQTNTFRLSISRTDRHDFYISLRDGILHIACPNQTDFTSERTQQILKGVMEKALRHEAHRVLPGRLSSLASKHGFTYKSVKISSSKGRWGSCSGSGNINLSLSLMLLPDHLIDYVLLHELCHTVEMNHSDRFWALLDKVSGNQAQALRDELKDYHTF